LERVDALIGWKRGSLNSDLSQPPESGTDDEKYPEGISDRSIEWIDSGMR
jgi:hypothetical protein